MLHHLLNTSTFLQRSKSCQLQHSHTHTQLHQSKRHMFLCTHTCLYSNMFSFFLCGITNPTPLPLNSAARRREFRNLLYEICSKSELGCSCSPANPDHRAEKNVFLSLVVSCIGNERGWGKYFWGHAEVGEGRKWSRKENGRWKRFETYTESRRTDGKAGKKEMIWRSKKVMGQVRREIKEQRIRGVTKICERRRLGARRKGIKPRTSFPCFCFFVFFFYFFE